MLGDQSSDMAVFIETAYRRTRTMFDTGRRAEYSDGYYTAPMATVYDNPANDDVNSLYMGHADCRPTFLTSVPQCVEDSGAYRDAVTLEYVRKASRTSHVSALASLEDPITDRGLELVRQPFVRRL